MRCWSEPFAASFFLQLSVAESFCTMNVQAVHMFPAVDEAADSAKETLQELVATLEESAASSGLVTSLVHSLTQAVSQVIALKSALRRLITELRLPGNRVAPISATRTSRSASPADLLRSKFVRGGPPTSKWNNKKSVGGETTTQYLDICRRVGLYNVPFNALAPPLVCRCHCNERID